MILVYVPTMVYYLLFLFLFRLIFYYYHYYCCCCCQLVCVFSVTSISVLIALFCFSLSIVNATCSLLLPFSFDFVLFVLFDILLIIIMIIDSFDGNGNQFNKIQNVTCAIYNQCECIRILYVTSNTTKHKIFCRFSRSMQPTCG